MDGHRRDWRWYAPIALIAAAVVLIVLHFALDAGDDREAPGWILYAGILLAVGATLIATTGRR